MMIRTLTILSAVAAVAGPAAAADIKINIVGKEAAQLQAEIRRAAKTVCLRELDRIAPFSRCVDAVTADAAAQLTAARATYGEAKAPLDVTRISAAK